MTKAYDVKSFGTLRSGHQYPVQTSISYDTVEFDPEAEFKVLVQMEPPSVLDQRAAFRECASEFDLILAWDEDLLDLPNARKFLFGDCWIDFTSFVEDEKENEISFITSSKNNTKGQRLRLDVYDRLRTAYGHFDVFRHKSPPWLASKNEFFEKAKFSIAIENEKRNNWFTEKLIDCFATETVPIYWGARNIAAYFNPDGIITFDTEAQLQSILGNLTESTYEDMQPAIQENYERSRQYWDFHTRIQKAILECLVPV